jgi:hypothetical protein
MEPGVATDENNSVLFHVMQKLHSNPEKDGAFFTSYFITCLLLQKQGIWYPKSTKIFKYRVSFQDFMM